MNNEKNFEKKSDSYYIGVDIGTNSVGYAVTDKNYRPLKFKGEPMLGVTLFESASQCDKRRGARSARRRLDRRQARVALIQELFCQEIAKVDPTFFVRIKESFLWREDKSENSLYGIDWDNCEYKKKFPTVHHLILFLMDPENADIEYDVRYVYIAIAWLVAHRGHFLIDVDGDKVEELTNIHPIYEKFAMWFEDNGYELPWQCDINEFFNVLSSDRSIRVKEKELLSLMCMSSDEEMPFDKKSLITLFSGGKLEIRKIFTEDEYKEAKEKICLDDPDGMEEVLPLIGDYADLILLMSAIYDCAKLSGLLEGCTYISERKVCQYEAHKKDLANLKYIIKKYCPSEYGKMFRRNSKNNNYSAYVGNFKSYDYDDDKKTCKKEDFYLYVKKVISSIEPYDEDKFIKDDILSRIESLKFMEKQVNSDNRLIPHQLYYAELNRILEKAEKKFEFLAIKDESGKTVSDKIRDVFNFRVPYYVGPLVSKEKSNYAWLERKADGRILPWNFDDMVDKDACEDAFIRRMTNRCVYLPNEDVIPKMSLLYSKYMILNAINNIKINETPISVEYKQILFDELFKKKKNVTYKAIIGSLRSWGLIGADEDGIVKGIDVLYKASYKPYHDFYNLITKGILCDDDVEEIITRLTCTEDKGRFKRWLKAWAGEKNKDLTDDDIKYIASKNYSDFGNFSKKFLNEIEGMCFETGEVGTVMYFLWNTNDNLMQIIADKNKYSFAEIIEKAKKDYYSEKLDNINSILEDMGISNAVKRPVIRTIDIISDIIKVKKHMPEKIFVEMSRGEDEENSKNSRKLSRKNQLLEYYKNFDKNEINDIKIKLEEMGEEGERKLQSESLYLYFAQLGRCMYCGKPIDDISMCDIDHIWPQSLIKDDSIHNNKVLVCKAENGKKGDIYPIFSEWRSQMHGFWSMLHDKKLVSDEKYRRLTRSTPFTDNEKEGFINRQIVETRQSTKAVCHILEQKYQSENTRIVYVKAGKVSDFRHKYGDINDKAFNLHLSNVDKSNMCLVKSRTANDIHHAYDAYLNIVVGNVYDEKFSKRFFDITKDKYSLNTDVIFGNPLFRDPSVWDPKVHLPIVDKTMLNQNVRLTKYQVKLKSGQNGGFYDQQILPASKGGNGNLIPLKEGLDTEKYGGYNKATVSFYTLVKYKSGKKYELTILPVELRIADKYLRDADFANDYIQEKLGNKATDITKPLGDRILKVNTLFSLDGFEVVLSGKDGDKCLMRSLMTPKYTAEWLAYIKRIENVQKKKKEHNNYTVNERFDGISKEKNIAFYDYLVDKINSPLYSKLPGSRICVCSGKRNVFENLDIKEQLDCIQNMILYIKSNRSGRCNMESVDGKSGEGSISISSNISNWAKKYKDVRIIDRSASGLFESVSGNLLDLIK